MASTTTTAAASAILAFTATNHNSTTRPLTTNSLKFPSPPSPFNDRRHVDGMYPGGIHGGFTGLSRKLDGQAPCRTSSSAGHKMEFAANRNCCIKPVCSTFSQAAGYVDYYGLNWDPTFVPLGKNKRTDKSTAKMYDAVIEAKKGNPPVMPAVMTPGGPLDLSSVLFRNRIIFIGQPINSQVAQRVISQLVTLAAIDENADILMYLNCPGGSTYSVLAIYDCMSWIKPKVGTVCFGVAASQGALLLAGGEKGMRYAMPNARIMIHQPQSGCGGHVEDVRRQVNEAVQSRHKVDKMYAAFTGQTLEKVQQYTERDRFFSSSEAFEFGLIDGVLETEY